MGVKKKSLSTVSKSFKSATINMQKLLKEIKDLQDNKILGVEEIFQFEDVEIETIQSRFARLLVGKYFKMDDEAYFLIKGIDNDIRQTKKSEVFDNESVFRFYITIDVISASNAISSFITLNLENKLEVAYDLENNILIGYEEVSDLEYFTNYSAALNKIVLPYVKFEREYDRTREINYRNIQRGINL